MEKHLEAYTVRKLKEIGATVYKLGQVKGIPDRLVIYKGAYIFLEFKNPNKTGKVSSVQKYRIKELKDNGGCVFVVDDMRQVREIVDNLQKGMDVKEWGLFV